jgi:F-type H+-transporting ATPase subunit b
VELTMNRPSGFDLMKILGVLLLAAGLTLGLSTVASAADAPARPAHQVEPGAATGEGHAADDHGEAKGERGPVPSFKEAFVPALLALIIFGVLVVVLGKTAWGPIAGGLKAREDKIRKDIEEAEATRAKAESTLKEYSARLATAEAQVRELLAKAQTDAEGIATRLKMQAQTESEEIKDRATRDIDAARKAAVAEVYEQAATISTSIAEKIIRRNLNADDQRELVRTSLSQLENAAV